MNMVKIKFIGVGPRIIAGKYMFNGDTRDLNEKLVGALRDDPDIEILDDGPWTFYDGPPEVQEVAALDQPNAPDPDLERIDDAGISGLDLAEPKEPDVTALDQSMADERVALEPWQEEAPQPARTSRKPRIVRAEPKSERKPRSKRK